MWSYCSSELGADRRLPRSGGFTLVELLVMIAIIGILAILGAKGYFRVMEDARKTASLSDLRQIGMAVLAFASEHNGQTPTAGGGIPFGSVDPATGQPAWTEQIEDHLGGDRRIFAQSHLKDSATGQYRPSYFLGCRAAYLQAEKAKVEPLFQSVRLALLQSPTRYVLVGEIQAFQFEPFDADPDNFTQDPAFGSSGQGSARIFFADGHAALHTRYDTSGITTTYEGTETSFVSPVN